MSEETESVPAGWYDDGSGRARWFDGSLWGEYADEQAAQEDQEVQVEYEHEEPLIVRRNRRSPFNPPQQDKSSTSTNLVSRDWATGLRASTSAKNSGLTRQRKVAGDLPEWAPTPPGELTVNRTQDSS